jgi:hypothetical protein
MGWDMDFSNERAKSGANEDLTAADVIDAYWWLLGRAPESLQAIERQLGQAKNPSDLHKRLLRSKEFRKKFDALAPKSSEPIPSGRDLDEDVERIVQLHVPKPGEQLCMSRSGREGSGLGRAA